MKKLLSIVAVFLLLSSVVVASSSINGEYEGKPIVKLTAYGNDIEATDTPAVILDGRTMVPIYMLEGIGIEAEWNAETYAVDVTNAEAELYLNDLEYYNHLSTKLQQDGFTLLQLHFINNHISSAINYNNQVFMFAGGLNTKQQIDDSFENLKTTFDDFSNQFIISEDSPIYNDFMTINLLLNEGLKYYEESINHFSEYHSNGKTTSYTEATNKFQSATEKLLEASQINGDLIIKYSSSFID